MYFQIPCCSLNTSRWSNYGRPKTYDAIGSDFHQDVLELFPPPTLCKSLQWLLFCQCWLLGYTCWLSEFHGRWMAHDVCQFLVQNQWICHDPMDGLNCCFPVSEGLLRSSLSLNTHLTRSHPCSMDWGWGQMSSFAMPPGTTVQRHDKNIHDTGAMRVANWNSKVLQTSEDNQHCTRLC